MQVNIASGSEPERTPSGCGTNGERREGLILNNAGSKALEAGGGQFSGGDVRVHRLGSFFVFVAEAGDLYTDAEWDGVNAIGPDLLVQLGGDANIAGTHLFACKLFNLAECTWGSSFARDLVQPFVQINSVLPCHGTLVRPRLRSHMKQEPRLRAPLLENEIVN